MQKQTGQTEIKKVHVFLKWKWQMDTIFSHLKPKRCNMVPGWAATVDVWLCYREVSGSLQKLSEDYSILKCSLSKVKLS